ncbi:hypothetical protein COO60DRAFT_1240456 [Scenedesmus sp. NREL 46B-D3]|nr:hypothetical protein COO60DRAFT_1240456 [Scenedesmus sp. NREL 46B-D3]
MDAPSDLLAVGADDAAPKGPAQQQMPQQHAHQPPPAQQLQQEPYPQPNLQQQQQQQPVGTPLSAPVTTPFSGLTMLPGGNAVHPSRVVSSTPVSPAAAAAAAAGVSSPSSEWGLRALRKPPSFTGRTTATIFSHHADLQQQQQQQQRQQQQPPQQEVCTDVASSVFAAHMASGALQPPALLDPADTFSILPARSQQEQQPQLRPRLSALQAASLQRHLLQPQQPQMQQQSPADLGMYSMHMQPGNTMQAAPGQLLPPQQQQQLGGVLGGLLGMGQQQQDTLDGLLGQVNQELMREAGARQYAALQFGTLDTIGTPSASAAAAAAAVAGVGFGPASTTDGVLHWQQQGALGGAGAGFGGAAVPGWMAGAGLGQFSGAGVGQQQVTVQGMQAGGAAADSNREVVRYSRVITCKTYLKRLNITQPMAEHLLPYHDLHAPPSRHGSGGCAAATDDDAADSPRGNSNSSGKPGSSYELLFKEEVAVVDREGARFRVQYEGVSCNQQKHLRLTSGWRDYIRAHNVEVGDTVVFERRGEERRVLHVSIVKGDGPPAADGPPSKRRRVSRAQAVQRLD